MAEIRVGEVAAPEGKKASGFISVSRTAGQIPIRIPLSIANGSADGPTLCVTAGVHGTEYSGIEAVRRLMTQLDVSTLRGGILAIPCVNTLGLGKNRGCPIDNRNINRVFPGNPDGSISEIIANSIFTQTISRSQYFVDLHDGEGGLYPFATYHRTGRRDLDEQSESMARSTGIREIVATETSYDRGQSYAEAAEQGIPSVLWEARGAAGFDESSINLHLAALENCMRFLHMIDGPVESPHVNLFEGFQTVSAHEGGFFYPRVNLGEELEKGQVIGEIADFFGERLETIKSPAKGMVLSLRINTAYAVDPGEWVCEIGLSELVAEKRPPL